MLKGLKAPKREKIEESEEDAAFKARKKAEAGALEAARQKGVC
jgi:Translation machinery associated TMA7